MMRYTVTLGFESDTFEFHFFASIAPACLSSEEPTLFDERFIVLQTNVSGLGMIPSILDTSSNVPAIVPACLANVALFAMVLHGTLEDTMTSLGNTVTFDVPS